MPWRTVAISGTCNSIELQWEGAVFPYTRKSELKSGISGITGNLNPVIVLTQEQERARECLIKIGFIDHVLSDGVHVLTADGLMINAHRNNSRSYPTAKEFEDGEIEWAKREVKAFKEGDLIGYYTSRERILRVGKPNPLNPNRFLSFSYYDRAGTIGPEQNYAGGLSLRDGFGWDFSNYRLLVVQTLPKPEDDATEDML